MNGLRRLIWDHWNIAHIARHGVTPEEVEAACHAEPVLYKESYKERLMLLGETPAGRVLAIVIGPVPGDPPGTYYPFTARPAHRRERRDYDHLRDRQEP
ncbi:MAG: BrnT family toxin [Chloroflexota bacterium]|nr:BrnT family toxin [Chloroflexota bacterium]